MDIFEALEKEHNEHRKLLNDVAETQGDSDERKRLFKALKDDVMAHANAEEQSLYAAMLEDPDLQGKGRHSVAEHKELDDFFDELEKTDMSSPTWLKTFNDLKDRLEHHMAEEEEEIFKAADAQMSDKTARRMAELFAKRKEAELSSAA